MSPNLRQLVRNMVWAWPNVHPLYLYATRRLRFAPDPPVGMEQDGFRFRLSRALQQFHIPAVFNSILVSAQSLKIILDPLMKSKD